MDGLEAVEIKLSLLRKDNTTLRLDSEFFLKHFVNISAIFENISTLKMSDVAKWITQGPNPTFSDGDIPCLTGRNISKGRIVYENSDIISQSEYALLARYQLKRGDTLITLKGRGSIGKIGFVTSEKTAIFSRNIGLIRPQKITPAYLNAFILSKYGQTLVLRGETGGTGQTTLTTTHLRTIPVPIFPKIEKIVGKLVEKSEIILNQSRCTYANAESMLLSYLGLDGYSSNPSGIAVKSLKASFDITGRLDSEYYQPKYEEILYAITNYKNSILEKIVTIKKSIEPGSELYCDEGIPFVRVSNLSKYEIGEPDIRIPINTVNNIERLFPKKNTILLSKDGSVGIAYRVEKDMECVTSGAILHLTVIDVKNILPDYLTLILNSVVVQMQAERDAGGSIIQHWKPSEVGNVVIPILGIDIQLEIATKVKESFALRKKSTELLELAKTAVEIAVEQGEDKALKLLIEKGVES